MAQPDGDKLPLEIGKRFSLQKHAENMLQTAPLSVRKIVEPCHGLLDELGVTNGSGPYRPAGGYENPNDDVEDEAVDAEYESVDDSRA